MGRFTCFFGCLILSLLLGGSGGCEPAAHLAWSPDGARGAYFAPVAGKLLPGAGYLLDGQGKVTDSLGPTFGSFAWSADSKALYFGGYDSKGPANDAAVRKWLVDAEDQPAPAAQQGDECPPMVLNRWQDGKVERLVQLGNRYVLFVHVSPDQSWVAVVAFSKQSQGDEGRNELFVYSTASKTLYEVSDSCGTGACFTGASKLAYVEADRNRSNALSTGEIVEVELDEAAEHLQRSALVDVLWDKTADVQPVEDGLMFTSVGRTFPAKASVHAEGEPVSLYHFTRANGGVAALAESTGPLFRPSPDGKRVLLIKITPASGATAEKRELVLVSANGSDGHVLRDISAYGSQIPMWPAWHGNDEITLLAPTGVEVPLAAGQEPRLRFEVLNYRINAQGGLGEGKAISGNWPVEMKPSMKAGDFGGH